MRKPSLRRAALAAAASALVAGAPVFAQAQGAPQPQPQARPHAAHADHADHADHSAHAAGTMTAAQVRAKLESQGYTDVHDVEFENGVWTADARSADGTKVDVSIDPKTGKVYPEGQVAKIGKEDVEAKLAAAGYTRVHDVEMDDGVWKADATDPQGRKVEVRLDPATGEVIGSGRD